MKKYQKAIDDFVQEFKEPYWPPLSQLARLTEEVGELARLFNHMYGSKPKKKEEAKQELGGEIADILFTVICMANSHNLDLDKEMDKVLLKSKTRDKNRFKKKE